MWEEQSTNLKSRIYAGRFPVEKTRLQSSPLLLPQCCLPTPPTQHLQFLYRLQRARGKVRERERKREGGGREGWQGERGEKERGRKRQVYRQVLIDSGGTCILFPLSYPKQDLVNLRTLGRYSDLAPVVPNKMFVLKYAELDAGVTQGKHRPHSSISTEQDRLSIWVTEQIWQAS